MIDTELLKYMYRLKYIPRYSTHPIVTKENVAEHSYYVVLFSMLLCDELNIEGEQRIKILHMAITHDVPEIIISDIPVSSKDALRLCGIKFEGINTELMRSIFPAYVEEIKELEELKTMEALIVKLADIVQCFQFCHHEKSIGNTNLEQLIAYAELSYKVIKEKLEKEHGIIATLFDE